MVSPLSSIQSKVVPSNGSPNGMIAVQACRMARKLAEQFKSSPWPKRHERWSNKLQKYTGKANMQKKKKPHLQLKLPVVLTLVGK